MALLLAPTVIVNSVAAVGPPAKACSAELVRRNGALGRLRGPPGGKAVRAQKRVDGFVIAIDQNRSALNDKRGDIHLERHIHLEQYYREAIQVFADTLPADHMNMGIAQIKLGRALVRQLRFSEAEEHLISGYAILSKQANPSLIHLQNARQNLVSVYDALKQPGKAQQFQAGLSATQPTAR